MAVAEEAEGERSFDRGILVLGIDRPSVVDFESARRVSTLTMAITRIPSKTPSIVKSDKIRRRRVSDHGDRYPWLWEK